MHVSIYDNDENELQDNLRRRQEECSRQTACHCSS